MASYISLNREGAADGDNLGREQEGERLERKDKEVSLLPTPVSFPASTSHLLTPPTLCPPPLPTTGPGGSL